ncbi:MAG: amino acid permease [Bryobacteraceae bacterium]
MGILRPGLSMGNQPQLVRAVGLIGLTAIVVNGMVGAGIFVLPATVAALLGPASPIAYLLAAVAAMIIGLSYAEAGSRFDRAGGPYLYAQEAFGEFLAFEVGWMFLFGRLAGAAAIANAFAAYLAYLLPELASSVGRAAVISLSIVAIAALNYAGVKYGSAVVNVLTIGKLIPLLIFVAAGLFAIDWRTFALPGVPAFGQLREASLVLLFAFGGFEFASVPSEEVIQSRRNLPIALIAGILVSSILYILIQVVCQGMLPGLGGDATPVANAAGNFLGPAGAGLMVFGAVLSTTGTNSTILLVGPRMLYALAQGGQLPAFFGRVHPQFRTPHIAVVLFSAAVLALALSGTFALLAALNAMARLLYSVVTCAAVPVLRRKMAPGGQAFRLPFGSLIPVLGVLLSLFLLSGVTQQQALIGGLGMLSGAAVYVSWQRFKGPAAI